MIGCIVAVGAFWLFGTADEGGPYGGASFMIRTTAITAVRESAGDSTEIYSAGVLTVLAVPMQVVLLALSSCGEEA